MPDVFLCYSREEFFGDTDLALPAMRRERGHWPDFCKPGGKDDFECR